MGNLSWNEIRDRAVEFATSWRGEAYEKGESQTFWSEFLKVFGVDRRRHGALFEHYAEKNDGRWGYIDMFYPAKLLVEQKSAGKDLDKARKQASEFLNALPESDLPEAIVTCDFTSFQFTNQTTGERIEFKLENLHKHVELFGFLLGQTSKHIAEQDPVNRRAAESMARLHNQLKDDNYLGHDLEVLLVRLVFLMFAEDSGIFDRGILLDYINNRTAEDGSDLGYHLIQIFQILNTPTSKRQKNLLDEALASLPYVNGELFSEPINAPSFNSVMRRDLIKAMELDWSSVSPAIFGSMFQGVMDEEQRRNLGAHYTSEANILKVIKPLFLDNLYAEFRLATQAGKLKKFKELGKLQNKIASLKFLDPACGCGNFLVITYRELRRLEHKIVEILFKQADQVVMFVGPDVSPLKVNVDQMYGIEIEEFPSLVAQTALWLTDHQMNMEYSSFAAHAFQRIPLVTSATIVHANALTKDWSEIVDAGKLNYILGNPPFAGSKMMTPAMRNELLEQFSNIKGAGVLDYVSAWYAKATATMRRNRNIKTALVSTNSIVQGEQVPVLWPYLFKQEVSIDFAHQTFRWNNDAKGNAAVYCVIVGFSLGDHGQKRIYEYEDIKAEPVEINASNINAYLIDAPNIFIERRGKPSSQIPPMQFGNMPLDGGHLILTVESKNELIAKEPQAKKYIKNLIGAKELLQGSSRWCLWLLEVTPSELRQMPEVLKRVEKVRQFRLASTAPSTREHAIRPAEFRDTANPESYIVIPRVSSERREYVPMGFFGKNEIVGDTCQLVPDATLYHFGVLTSRIHMAWMRVVAGRLKSDYRYSKDIVYNNFVWPDVSNHQKDQITGLAQAVLDARAKYPEATLADLYDPTTMPSSLRRAHNTLDRTVDELYGLQPSILDAERVAHLFELYQDYQSKHE